MLSELKSPQFIRYSTIFFCCLCHCFPWNGTTAKELICTVNTFHVGIVFLDAGRFYNILSHFLFFFLFSVVEAEVSWIIDIIWAMYLSFHVRRRISPFLENIMSPFFILNVFIFRFGSKPLFSLVVPQTSVFWSSNLADVAL